MFGEQPFRPSRSIGLTHNVTAVASCAGWLMRKSMMQLVVLHIAKNLAWLVS